MANNDNIPKLKYDFDDILIKPRVTTKITSRYEDIQLPSIFPLFTAPMDTVVNLDNMDHFFAKGINVALPRTVKYIDFKNFCTEYNIRENSFENTFFSFGFSDLEILLKNKFKNLHHHAHILIDVANGHMEKIVDYCVKIKELRPDIIIMVGNIANPQTYEIYAESECVDYIRIGIGNGGGCLTTKQSGIGYPMASLIHETFLVKQQFSEKVKQNKEHKNSILKIKQYSTIPAIVADGGMKDYSDIVKALALGADYVMLGSIFNKALESSGDNYYHGKKIDSEKAKRLFLKGKKVKKYFRGMSTKSAQKAMGKANIKTSEGVERLRPVEYTLEKWIENFEHYLRNAMSYSNAKTLDEFIGKVPICQITTRAYDRFNK